MVTGDALTGRNPAREHVLDRVPRFVPGDRGIVGGAARTVAERREVGGVRRRAVVGVHDVAGGAAARPVVAGLIVGPEERQHRVEEPRPLQVQPHGIGAVEGTQAPRAESIGRLARRLVDERHAQLELSLLAALEDAKHVARLSHLEAGQGIEEGQDPLAQRLLGCGRRDRVEPPRPAVLVVTLPEARQLPRERAVVVERRGPQHRARRHHALLDERDLGGVAAGLAAALSGRAQVAGIHEANELGRFLVERREATLRVGRRLPQVVHPRPHVGLPLGRVVGRRAGGRVGGLDHVALAAMTVDAGRLDGRGLVHRRRIGLRVTAHATRILLVDVELGLPAQVGADSRGRLGLRPRWGRRLRRCLGRLFLLGRRAADPLGELDMALAGGRGNGADALAHARRRPRGCKRHDGQQCGDDEQRSRPHSLARAREPHQQARGPHQYIRVSERKAEYSVSYGNDFVLSRPFGPNRNVVSV